MTITDTHCHLDDPRYEEGPAAVVRRAHEAGVGRMITIGCDLATSRSAVAIAGSHPSVWAAVGVHPSECGRISVAEWPEMERLGADPRVVAIGECGLDAFRAETAPDLQEAWFRRHAALARNLHKPLVIHCRDAFPEMLRLLREERAHEVGGLLHCYAGSAEQEGPFLDLGLLLAFGGTVTFPKNDKGRNAAIAAPAGSLVFETDAPYLAPQAYRGRRNEPAYAVETARFVAGLRGADPSALAEATEANVDRLFSRMVA